MIALMVEFGELVRGATRNAGFGIRWSGTLSRVPRFGAGSVRSCSGRRIRLLCEKDQTVAYACFERGNKQ